MSNETNMPAFPTPQLAGSAGDYVMESYGGLTKREYFAGLAMQGFLSGSVNSVFLQASPGHLLTHAVAEASIDYADALLAALDATP